MKRNLRTFEKLLADNGMTLKPSNNGHVLVMKGGKCVSSVSSTASDPNYLRQAIRVLVRDGHLPHDAKRMKI